MLYQSNLEFFFLNTSISNIMSNEISSRTGQMSQRRDGWALDCNTLPTQNDFFLEITNPYLPISSTQQSEKYEEIELLTIYALILAVFFVIGGTMNLLASDVTQADYARWGHPTWFPYLTGILEWAAAILLVFRATRLLGAALAGSVMIASAGTLIINGEYAYSIEPITVLVLVAAYAIIHAKMNDEERSDPSKSHITDLKAQQPGNIVASFSNARLLENPEL
ncbi:DoxX family protein [Thalassospira sp. GO-4]|jgi:uncharacterized membrane protein YphA (DoxX/SURF4 family)|uniref:DoxX family protein n=1 Tax=Thalassospira sp. GO-4 TaxID=2946605 RepID=UPI002024FCCE|nr:DoxX family protein [Thalassospira sp. GO-4]URK17494.1 DoxX family protein [Thalassospira sp. GO-4]